MTEPLLALMLLAGILGLTLLPMFGPERGLEDPSPENELLARRAELVAALRDLDMDFETGKITEADRDRMRGELEGRAIHVLAALDEAQAKT